MLTFIAETREYAGGVLHNGDKPTGESIARHLARVPAIWRGCPPFGEGARHLARVMDTLPKTVETFRARADAGFSCWEAVKAYTDLRWEFVIVARKTDRLLGKLVGPVCLASLLGELQAADWRPSPDTDADFACPFRYQPEGWEREYRFVGLRYDQPEPDADHPDQIGLFDGLACRYPVFVTNISSEKGSPAAVVAFYNKRAAVETLIT
jgi:hypothetical protein